MPASLGSGSANSQPVASEDIPIAGSPLISTFPEPKAVAYTISTADAYTVIIKYSGFPDVNKFLTDYQSVHKATGRTNVSYLAGQKGVSNNC